MLYYFILSFFGWITHLTIFIQPLIVVLVKEYFSVEAVNKDTHRRQNNNPKKAPFFLLAKQLTVNMPLYSLHEFGPESQWPFGRPLPDLRF